MWQLLKRYDMARFSHSYTFNIVTSSLSSSGKQFMLAPCNMVFSTVSWLKMSDRYCNCNQWWFRFLERIFQSLIYIRTWLSYRLCKLIHISPCHFVYVAFIFYKVFSAVVLVKKLTKRKLPRMLFSYLYLKYLKRIKLNE